MAQPGVYLVRPGPWGRFGHLLKAALIAFYEDGCFMAAKAAAYSALLGFFPVLAAVAAILVQANAKEISNILSDFLFEVVPPGSEELIRYEFAFRGQRPIYLIVLASGLAIWAASGVMLSLMEGFQAAYKLPTGRPLLQQRAVAALLVIITVFPAVGASLLIFFGARTEALFLEWVQETPGGAELSLGLFWFGRTVRYAIAFATVVLVASMLYYYGPNRPMKIRWVWPGALLATIVWLIATLGFSWYVQNIANYNFLYGSIGAVIALLFWMFMLMVVALYGCEFNAELERLADTGTL